MTGEPQDPGLSPGGCGWVQIPVSGNIGQHCPTAHPSSGWCALLSGRITKGLESNVSMGKISNKFLSVEMVIDKGTLTKATVAEVEKRNEGVKMSRTW